jgi:hypothetical protein
VRHVGEELGLVTTRGLELPALVLDFMKETGILDGQGRLRREDSQQLDGFDWKVAGPVAGYPKTADQLALAGHRNGEDGPDAGLDQVLP